MRKSDNFLKFYEIIPVINLEQLHDNCITLTHNTKGNCSEILFSIGDRYLFFR